MPTPTELTLTQRPDGYFAVDEAAGKALDAVLDDDRKFFDRHPERTLRVRRPHKVELAQFELTRADLPRGTRWYIGVKKTGPVTRQRGAFWAARLHQPEKFSEAVCAALFAQLDLAVPHTMA